MNRSNQLLLLLLVCLQVAATGRLHALDEAKSTSPPEAAKTIKSSPKAELPRPKKRTKTSDCEYEKGAWSECQSNGMQQRELRLVASPSNEPAGPKCDPVRLVRRECRSGCKYTRGEWSSECENGLRQRLDRLVPAASNATLQCQPQRRVSKECKRACHYVKSVWSECSNGFRTRNLTLADGQPAATACAKEKQIRRECRKLNAAQKRRLKQIQQRQQS